MASEIKVDTVSEKTSANGVTIDGVNIKDSKIVTANSIDSDVYVDGSIDTAHIADLNVTTGKIAADAITGAKIADDAINSEHYTDGSIDTAHLADGQVTIGKLATAVLTGATDIGAAIADADLLLVDDGAGGTLRKTTASRLKTYIGDNTPAFDVRLTSNQTIANNTFTKLAFATETLDSDGKFASNKFTPTVAGYYFITYSIYYDVVDDNEILSLKIYKNGSGDNATERNNFATGTNNDIMVWGTYLIYLDADDYIELYTKQGSGGDATAYTGNTTFSGFRVSGV